MRFSSPSLPLSLGPGCSHFVLCRPIYPPLPGCPSDASAKVCGGPCGPGRTSMFQLFPVVKGLTPSSRGEGAAALRLDKLTSSNSMFSYVLSYNYLITAIYRSKRIDGFLLCILYSGLISPNPPR